MLAYGRQATAILLIGMLSSGSVRAADDLVNRAQAAKDAYRALEQADVAAARADLDNAAAALEARFAYAGDSANGWRTYLDWGRLQEELAKPDGPDLPQLETTFQRLSAEYEGLGLLCFRDLRDSIHRYVGVVRGVEGTGLQAGYEKVVDRLAASLESYSKAPNGQDAAMISAYLRWLSDARQAPDLIEAVRSASLKRNFYAKVSAKLLNAAMGRDVDETAPVHDNILGTRIYGTGHTTGRVDVELVPTEGRATIMTVMRGTNIANTVGYNGPVVVRAGGTSEITVRKPVLIDGERLWTMPAEANVNTRSQINSITARNGMRIIENVAWKRARKQKCQADAIAAQHAECEVRTRFDAEVDELIDPANDDIQKKVRGPLVERGLYPAELNYSSDANFLNLSILQAGPQDLAATTSPPPAAADADLSVQIHESMINNFTSAALAGMLLREQRVQEAVKNLLGKLPKELEPEEGSLPWGITFQSARPIWVTFQDNQFTLSIRGRSFSEGDQRHPGMDVTVTYQIQGEGANLKAVRQGEVEIFPPGFDPDGDKPLTAQQTAIRRILQRRLGKLFEEEIIPKGLELPEEWSRAGVLDLVQWQAQDGWLVLAWKHSSEPTPEAETAEVAFAQ